MSLEVGNFIKKNLVAPAQIAVEVPIRKMLIKLTLNRLGVKVENTITEAEFKVMREYFQDSDSKIIITHKEHKDSIEWLVLSYIILEHLPQLYPYLVFVAAKDTWKDRRIRTLAHIFVGSIRLFSRKEEDSFKEISRLRKSLKTKGHHVPVVSRKAGRGEKAVVKGLPAFLAAVVPPALLILLDISTAEGEHVFEKRTKKDEPEAPAMIQQIREATNRRAQDVFIEVKVALMGVISTDHRSKSHEVIEEMETTFGDGALEEEVL